MPVAFDGLSQEVGGHGNEGGSSMTFFLDAKFPSEFSEGQLIASCTIEWSRSWFGDRP